MSKFYTIAGKIASSFVLLVFVCNLVSPQIASATVYQPGATLEPDCAPGSANCGVATTTDAIAEGTNLYFTNARSDARFVTDLAATSSVGSITTLSNLLLSATQLTNFGTPFYTFFSATTTTALAEGINLYFTNARADTRLSATTSLPNITTLAGLSLPATQLTSFGTPFWTFFNGTTTDALAQGVTNKYYSTNLFAGSLAGTTTSALAEGSNLYFTNTRADNRFITDLAATSSVGSITTLSNLLLSATQLINFGTPFYTFFSATTTDALTQGSTNKYYSDTPVNSYIHASSTIPKTYTANIFTAGNTFNNGLTIDSLNGPLQANNGAVSATTSIGVTYGGTGQTSWTKGDILYASDANTLSKLPLGSFGTVLTAGGSGVPTWAAAGAGSNSTLSPWATTTNNLATYPAIPTTVVLVGASATTTTDNILEVTGNSLFGGNIKSAGLSTLGSLVVSGLTTLGNASTTLLSAYGPVYFGATATSSFSSTGALTLASALAVGSGGTGLTSITNNQLLIGSAGNTVTQIATSSLGLLTTNVAEGSNLYYTNNRVASVIAGTTTDALAQGSTNKYYSTNLFAGSLSGTTTNALTEGATNKYYTDTRVGSYISGSSTIPHIGGSSVGDLFSWTGSAWATRATSTLGVALADTTGTLGSTRGGTGLSTLTSNQLLIGGAGNTVTQIATSSLGLLTSNIAEGSNLYYTSNRVASVLAGTTTDALAQGSANKYYSTSLFAGSLAGTTTTALLEGTNLYYTDARVNSYIHASSTIPKIYTTNTFTGANTFNGGLTFDALNGPLQANAGVVSATTSVGVTYGGTGLTSTPSFGQMLRGTGTGYTLVATSTLGVNLSDTAGTLTVARGGTGSTDGSITGSGALSFTSNTTNALTLDSGTTGIINIGTNTNAKTITIGNGTGATSLVLNAGTGNIDIGANAVARTINVGTGAAVVETINIGGTGANVIGIGNTQTAGSVNIGAAMTTGTITIGGTGAQTGTITIDGGTGTQTINLGTGAGVKTVNVGSTNGASVTTIQAGSGGIVLTGVLANANKTVLCIDSVTHQLVLGASNTSCNASSERYKHDIQNITLGLDATLALRPVSFTYNSDNQKKLGFIAEEVALVDSRLAVYDNNGVIQAIDPDEFSAILVKAIQEQQVFLGDISPKVNADGSDNGLSTLIATIQSETAHDPIAVITKKITDGKQFLTDFVAVRVTAIRGYFDEVFAKKIHTEELCIKKSDGNEVCVNGDQVNSLFQNGNEIPVVIPVAPVEPIVTPDSTSSPQVAPEPTPQPSPEVSPPPAETPPAAEQPVPVETDATQ